MRPTSQRETAREKLARDLAEYKRRGGKVKRIPTGRGSPFVRISG